MRTVERFHSSAYIACRSPKLGPRPELKLSFNLVHTCEINTPIFWNWAVSGYKNDFPWSRFSPPKMSPSVSSPSGTTLFNDPLEPWHCLPRHEPTDTSRPKEAAAVRRTQNSQTLAPCARRIRIVFSPSIWTARPGTGLVSQCIEWSTVRPLRYRSRIRLR